IFWAYLSPMPGRALSWSSVAVLRSTRSAVSAVVPAAADLPVACGKEVGAGCEKAKETPSTAATTAHSMAFIILFILILSYPFLFFLSRAVAGLLSIRFRHVLALLGLAIPPGPLLVVNPRIGIHPNHAVAVGWRSLL